MISFQTRRLVDGFAGLAVGVGQQIFPETLHLHQQLLVAAFQLVGVAAEHVGVHLPDPLPFLIFRQGLPLRIFQCQCRIGQ